MIDIKLLRENPDLVRASQKGRGEDVTIVDQVLAIDDVRRTAITEFETLRAEQNTLSKFNVIFCFKTIFSEITWCANVFNGYEICFATDWGFWVQ